MALAAQCTNGEVPFLQYRRHSEADTRGCNSFAWVHHAKSQGSIARNTLSLAGSFGM